MVIANTFCRWDPEGEDYLMIRQSVCSIFIPLFCYQCSSAIWDSCCGRLCCATLHWYFQYTSPAGWPGPPPSHLCRHHFRVYFWLGQCHFPLCMWILEIRLSTVIVHRVEPSVIVQPERSQGFHYTGERWNKWSTDRKKTNTRHNMSEHLLYSVYMP